MSNDITEQELMLLINNFRYLDKQYLDNNGKEIVLLEKLVNSYYYYKDKCTKLEQKLTETELDLEDYWL